MNKTLLRICAAISAISGVSIIAFVVYPIVSYDKIYSKKFQSQKFQIQKEEPIVNPQSVDYTRASNWFVGGAPREDFVPRNVSNYTLTIPKLKIENATVTINGDDLAKSLIQYPGTALPGKFGNTVIFGHSTLPAFYNPKKYISIFSKLPTLEKGDEIFVDYDGVSYKYRVEEMFEVSPTDIQVLDQDASDSFLTLVTCVPPGHPLKPKRLIVRARVVPPAQANENIRN